jgi:isoleucyl-tRNA synthetase
MAYFMFTFDQSETFSQREERILQVWQEHKFFERSIEARKEGQLFTIYDGPPFATGLPHYGHLLAGTIKDVIPRYKTMKGYFVPRRFGWDCHGLPIENEIEKAQQLSGADAIEQFGIAEFNEECRKIVLRYTGEWKKTVDRMGRWVDFSQTYRTMDLAFMESVWWVFKQIFESGLVYEGFKVMPFSIKLGTPLSNFEANLNYKEVDDPSATIQFQVLDEPHTYFLAWTTTPWTLPSNLALMVGPEITYVKVRKGNKQYILAEARLEANFKADSEVEILERMSGKELDGRRYVPLFPFFAERSKEGAFRVILDDAVSVEDGTGIVHSCR